MTMTTIYENASIQNYYYEYANESIDKTTTQAERAVVRNDVEENKVVSDASSGINREATYNRKTLLGMDKKDILANMIDHMHYAETSEKIRDLKNEINPGELYSFRIDGGKIRVSGSDGFAGKAKAYERLVNASLNSSWNQMFKGDSVSEDSLMNKVDGILRFYMDEDYAIKKNNRMDSIENHITDVFDKWKKLIQPEQIHFDGKI